MAEKMIVPRPRGPGMDEWCRTVLERIHAADRDARELAGLPQRSRRSLSASTRPRRRPSTGTCLGCGCHYDDKTDGCVRCRVRHAVRAHHDRHRLERAA